MLPAAIEGWRRQLSGNPWFTAEKSTYFLARQGSLASAHESRLMWEEAAKTGAILTVEEHNVIGGLGSAVAEVLVDCARVPFRRHGIEDEFAPVGPPAGLYAHYKLDEAGIAETASAMLRGS